MVLCLLLVIVSCTSNADGAKGREDPNDSVIETGDSNINKSYYNTFIDLSSFISRLENLNGFTEEDSINYESKVPTELKSFYENKFYISKCIALPLYANSSTKVFTQYVSGLMIDKLIISEKVKFVKNLFSNNLSELNHQFTYNIDINLDDITYKYDLYMDNIYQQISFGIDKDGNIYLLSYEKSDIETDKYLITQGYLIKPYENNFNVKNIITEAVNNNKMVDYNTASTCGRDFNISSKYITSVDSTKTIEYYCLGENIILSKNIKTGQNQVALVHNNLIIRVCDDENLFESFIKSYYKLDENFIIKYYYFTTYLTIFENANKPMKGIEVYAWMENGEFKMVLLPGTNRNKTVAQAKETLTLTVVEAKKILKGYSKNEVSINIISPLEQMEGEYLEITKSSADSSAEEKNLIKELYEKLELEN